MTNKQIKLIRKYTKKLLCDTLVENHTKNRIVKKLIMEYNQLTNLKQKLFWDQLNEAIK